MSSRDVEKARQRRYMLKTLKESPRGEPSTKISPLDDLLVEKKGGKVSKSKGGTIKKMRGGKLHNKKTKTTYDNHHGSKLIASLYDLGE